MANNLTGIIPTLYEALNVVSREMVGFIPAVNRDSNAERAALNQVVRSPVGEAGELEDIVPGEQPANSGDTTVGHVDVTISKAKAAPVRWNGEEQKAVGSSGQYNKVLADQFADAMRKLVNEVEIDLAVEAKLGASRAVGTAGTTPFGTAGDLSDFADLAQILDDNGTPIVDRQLVLSSPAMNHLRGKQSVLFKVNEAGSEDMLRTGYTDEVGGFFLRYSRGLQRHVSTSSAGFATTGAHAAGINQIAFAASATAGDLFNAGDVVTIDGNKYVANTNVVQSGGVMGINQPGLLADVATGTAVVSSASYIPSIAFARNAVVLAARAPAVPEGGDSAVDSMMITDPLTGMTFEVRMYRQYRQVKYEVCLAWGVKAIKPEHIALLMG